MKRYYRNAEIAVVEECESTIIMVPSTGKIHELDEVSSFIWMQIPKDQEGINVQEIAERLVQAYDVDKITATKDISMIVEILAAESVVVAIV